MTDKRTSKIWIRRALGALLSLGIGSVIVLAFLPDPIPVDLGSVTRGTLLVTVEEDGFARVKDRYVVSAPLLVRGWNRVRPL